GGKNDLKPQSLPMTFGEHQHIDEVGEGLLLNRLQEVTVGPQPALGAGAVEFGSTNIGRIEHRLHGMLGARQQSAQMPPVSTEVRVTVHLCRSTPIKDLK
ncbi:MAG: hypothetical protein ABGX16_20025, partial [Pirellulales bacterium]